MGNKISVGYGSDKRSYRSKGYGGVTGGKVKHNGGFNFAPVSSFEKISEEQWKKAFGEDKGIPWYERPDRYKG